MKTVADRTLIQKATDFLNGSKLNFQIYRMSALMKDTTNFNEEMYFSSIQSNTVLFLRLTQTFLSVLHRLLLNLSSLTLRG